MATNQRYILITPARNEAKYIKATVESVANQTLLPFRWVIVSDSSTDGTDEFVQESQKKYPFILFTRNSERKFNDFRSKVISFNIGFELIKNETFDFIGNLDADVSFDKNYFASILSKFKENERLGITGGHIFEVYGKTNKPHLISKNSVAGAVQMFRRECYEEIGGYLALPMGGIDSAAEIMARSRGWNVRTFFEYRVNHHKPMKTGSKNKIQSKIKLGKCNYSMGYHPLFQVFSCGLRIFDKPLILGSAATLLGFLIGTFKKTPQILPPDAIAYLRNEQMHRLLCAMRLKKKTMRFHK